MPAPYNHPAAWDEERVLAACAVRRVRASGPGGQHRNKVETGVELLHQPTGLNGWAAERRSQDENRRMALFRLRVNLALGVRRPLDPHARASALWRSRCRAPRSAPPAGSVAAAPLGRIAVNPRHRDFPALLAEALDVLAACGHDPKAAGAVLGCSMSQLVKLLKDEPRALALVNQARTQRGLHDLK